MKMVFYTSFLLIGLISWSLNNLAFADCDSTGKPIGAGCDYEVCEAGLKECANVCFNGFCRECADDSDCQSGHCVENGCQ